LDSVKYIKFSSESLRNKWFCGSLGTCLPMKPPAKTQKRSNH
jgi:hypothetical protein